MPIDPMTGAMIANAGISLFSSIFGKKKKPPQYQAPQYQSGAQLPQYAQAMQQQAYDPATGPVYQQLLQQMTSGQLPPELRQATLGQAQGEAQNAYNAANSMLTFDEDRAMRGASERMNKMGLLSSGAHGVTQGLIGEGYARQRGVLAGNLQNQMGAASTGLMQQEFAQKDRIQALLAGIENQRQNASVTSRGQLLNFAQADAQNQNSMALGNAQAQYGSQSNAFNLGQDQQGKMYDSLKSLVSAYGAMQGGRRGARRTR